MAPAPQEHQPQRKLALAQAPREMVLIVVRYGAGSVRRFHAATRCGRRSGNTVQALRRQLRYRERATE
eukprot:776646-Pelagomonas_calceolata.AAC.1